MYNIWNAAAYEITNILIDFDTKWEMNPIIKQIRLHCFPDWVEWKTERTMNKVDQQIKEIQSEWKQQDHDLYVKPVVRQHEPDGSKAQDLLGGTIQMSAPWYKPPQ